MSRVPMPSGLRGAASSVGACVTDAGRRRDAREALPRRLPRVLAGS